LKKVSITKHEITINYKKYAQTEEDENLYKNTVNTLRNALQVLETRLITNIGGKVQYYIVPDTDIPFKSKWILVQVYRGLVQLQTDIFLFKSKTKLNKKNKYLVV
jgi:hypothetical protein